MNALSEAVEFFIYRVAAEIGNEAQIQAPYRTGNLRNDIKVYVDGIESGNVEVGNSTLAPYAAFVHQGTGIYGPKKKPITPKKGKALKFSTKGGDVFCKSVKGQKPNPYMTRAAANYLAHGGMDRAEEDFAAEVGEEVINQVRQVLQLPITISFG